MRLKNRVEELEKKLNEVEQTLEFILEYGKDTIKVWREKESDGYFLSWGHKYYICAKYIKNGKVCEVKKEIPYYVENLSIEKNPDGTYFIKGKNLEEKAVYFQLLKDTGEIIDITEIKEHFENQEKITENLKASAEEIAKAFNSLFGKKETQKTENIAGSGKEENKENITTETNKIDKNPIKYKDPVNSALMKYYIKYGLDLRIKDFSPIKRLSEKEASTLLYLFDRYKYVNEIVKHIDLSRNSIITFAYTLKKAGYLIYSREMGRVANGCLIYNK